MITFTPTEEQAAILEAAVKTKDNILINALAGAAKTSTLELICRTLPVQPILSLAFNRKIAEEMKTRLPGHVAAKTINAVGHGVWAQTTGRRLVVDARKSFELLKAFNDDQPSSRRKELRDTFADTLRAIGAAKMAGYVPEGQFPTAKRLITREEFYDGLEEDIDVEAFEEVLTRSIHLAYQGTIDFDDQIYMPTLFGGAFPRFPLVMVDEAQDLSPLNHAMLEKLVTNRLIAVGDPYQSIYAFRGADTASMARLQRTFSMVAMPLSISFRCPIEIVKRAHFRAPHMQWAEWAIPGEIFAPSDWSASALPDGAAIICRNNAPLFRCALELLKLGRGVKLVGTDLGPQLVRALKKLGPETMTRQETEHAIDAWVEERLRKSKAKAAIHDKADCLRVFASFGYTLSAAIAYAEHLFAASGPIQLLSGHKAKGLEWDVVFHLDPWRIPSKFAEGPEALDQELNVRYVVETRPRKQLWLVNLDTLKP